MGSENLSSLSSRTIIPEHCCDEACPATIVSTTKTGKMRWKMLWMRFKKQKKKFFVSAGRQELSYDPYTYQQNFDQGPAWIEADDVSRSFSVRFADPSRVYVK